MWMVQLKLATESAIVQEISINHNYIINQFLLKNVPHCSFLKSVSMVSVAKFHSSSPQPVEGWKPWHCGRSCGPLEALGKIARRPKGQERHCIKATKSRGEVTQHLFFLPSVQMKKCALPKWQENSLELEHSLRPAKKCRSAYIPTAGGCCQVSGCLWCSCQVLNKCSARGSNALMRSEARMFHDKYAVKRRGSLMNLSSNIAVVWQHLQTSSFHEEYPTIDWGVLETGIQPISYTDRTAIQRMQLQCVSVLSVDATVSYSFITPEQSYSIVLQASTVNAVAHIVHTKIVASPRAAFIQLFSGDVSEMLWMPGGPGKGTQTVYPETHEVSPLWTTRKHRRNALCNSTVWKPTR